MVARVVATAYGGPEVLAVVDEDIGGPGPGEVLVEIRAAAANPIDYKLYSGAMGRDPGALPMRLGYEASGTVLEIGSGAEGRRARSASVTRSSPSGRPAPTQRGSSWRDSPGSLSGATAGIS